MSAWLDYFFTPQMYHFWNNTSTDAFIILNNNDDDYFENLLLIKLIVKYLLSRVVRLDTLKGTAKTPAVRPSEVGHPKRDQSRFFNP